MRGRIATIATAIIIGGIVGGLGLLLVIQTTKQTKIVDGQPLSYWEKCLDGKDALLKSRAVAALPQFSSEAIDPTITLLDHESAQDSAAEVLAAIGAPAVRPLIGILQTGSPRQQFGALKAIDRMKGPADPDAVAMSAEVLRGDDDTIAPLAESYLLRVGPTPRACDVAATIVQSGSTAQKVRAIKVMIAGKNLDRHCADALLGALRDREDVYAARVAFNAVTRLQPPRAELLEGMISCAAMFGDRRMDESVQRTLSSMGKSAVPGLRRMTTRPASGERLAAVNALRTIAIAQGDSTAEDALADFAQDSDETVSLGAIVVLPDRFWAQRNFAEKQLHSRFASIRDVAVRRSLKLRPAPVERLADALDDVDSSVRKTARFGITELAMQKVVTIAKPSSNDAGERSRQVRLLAFRIAEDRDALILQAIDDPSPVVRLEALHAMLQNNINDKFADAIRKAASDPDREVAATAKESSDRETSAAQAH